MGLSFSVCHKQLTIIYIYNKKSFNDKKFFIILYGFPMTMNYRTLLIPALVLTLQSAAQPRTSLSSLHPVTIHLRHPTSPPIGREACFSHFEVIDERADTSRIGVHTSVPDFGRNHDRQLVFDRSAAGEMADFLNRRFTRPDAPYTALVILRTLWLSDASYIREDLVRHPELRFERTHIHLKVEVYAIRDGRYIPVLRFDTLQTAWKKRLLQERSTYHEWGQNLVLLMDELGDSTSRVAARKENGPWVALEDIRQFNSSRFEAPIAETPPARGVYANFEEFRNNTPSIQDFEIKTENNEHLLYIRESGNTYYSHDAWGYCDGKDIYVMRDGVLCPAWKEGKAFYLPAAVTAGSTLTIARSHDYKQRSIYSIDMDTGAIY